MTPEKQRIAIAEFCGARLIQALHCDCPTWKACWLITLDTQDITELNYTACPYCKTPFKVRPDYLNDLNAMHEAFISLSEAKKVVFTETLFAITKGLVVNWGYYPGDTEIEWDSIATVVNATAAQRAEALLRTIGKWEEA